MVASIQIVNLLRMKTARVCLELVAKLKELKSKKA
jgi:hypothetical protein